MVHIYSKLLTQRQKTSSMSTMPDSKRGFTLIELLVVVVIIGILVGIAINTVNINTQRQRANESVVRTNIGKICSTISSCNASNISMDTNNCDGWGEIGAILPNEPSAATYTLSDDNALATNATGYVLIKGVTGSCTIGCFVMNNLGNGPVNSITAQSGEVKNHSANCLTD